MSIAKVTVNTRDKHAGTVANFGRAGSSTARPYVVHSKSSKEKKYQIHASFLELFMKGQPVELPFLIDRQETIREISFDRFNWLLVVTTNGTEAD